MARAPFVSVVLPCFNGATTLADAIGSIRLQTLADWELIVCDDGSTDGSDRIGGAFAAADSRIRVMASAGAMGEGRHVGIVGALQRGCAEARGEFIARMDADDISHPQRLERQLELMRADSDLAICGTRVKMVGDLIGEGRIRYENWVNSLVNHEDIVRDLFVECPLPHPTFLMRREAFEEVGGYEDHGWAEDYDLCMRFFLAGKRFGKAREVLLDWRDTAGRLSMVDPRYELARFRALKRHYLGKSYLQGGRPFYQWGAGEVGKLWLREWREPGIDCGTPVAVVDINPRKVGRAIHGVPVIAPEELRSPGDVFVVVAVGAPDARDQIRGWFGPRGYCELKHFVFLA